MYNLLAGCTSDLSLQHLQHINIFQQYLMNGSYNHGSNTLTLEIPL